MVFHRNLCTRQHHYSKHTKSSHLYLSGVRKVSWLFIYFYKSDFYLNQIFFILDHFYLMISGGAPLFQHWFPWLFHDPKMKNPWPIGTTYISKSTIHDLWMHTRISSDSSIGSYYNCQKDKITRLFTHIYKYFTTVQHEFIHCSWSCVTFTELLSAVVKFPWFHDIIIIFHDFSRAVTVLRFHFRFGFGSVLHRKPRFRFFPVSVSREICVKQTINCKRNNFIREPHQLRRI